MLLLYVRVLMVFSYSVDIDGLEYYFVHIIQEMHQGRPMYADPQVFPYSINLYTPVYFYILSAIVYICHLDIYDDLYKILIIGRMLSLFIVCIQILYLVKLLLRFTSSGFIIIVAVTLYILLISGHIYAIRPDALKILLFTMFVYYFTAYLFFSGKFIHAVFCVLLSTLNVYTKQDIVTYLSLIFFTAFYLLRDKRTVFLFLCFGFNCAICLSLLWFIYGNHLLENLILYNIQTILDYYNSYNIIFIGFSILRTGPLLILIILNLRKLQKEDPSYTAKKIICLTPLVFYPFTYLSLLRPGSNLNYTYELTIFMILNFGLFSILYKEQLLRQKIRYTGILLLYCTTIFFSNLFINNYHFDREKQQVYKQEFFDCMRERVLVKDFIRNDTVFFPNTKYCVFFADNNVVLGHDMHLDRFINLYTSVYIKSKLTFVSTAAYDANFLNGRVKYIIIHNDKKSAAHVSRYYPYYQYTRLIGHFLIYRYINK